MARSYTTSASFHPLLTAQFDCRQLRSLKEVSQFVNPPPSWRTRLPHEGSDDEQNRPRSMARGLHPSLFLGCFRNNSTFISLLGFYSTDEHRFRNVCSGLVSVQRTWSWYQPIAPYTLMPSGRRLNFSLFSSLFSLFSFLFSLFSSCVICDLWFSSPLILAARLGRDTRVPTCNKKELSSHQEFYQRCRLAIGPPSAYLH